MPITSGNFEDLVQLSQDTFYYVGPDFQIGNTSVGTTARVGFNNTAGEIVLVGVATGNATVNLPVGNGTLMADLGVSAGTTSQALSNLVFSNVGAVTWGLNGSTVTASAAGGSSASINFSAGTTSQNLLTAVLSNSNNVSFGLNGSTITASANLTGEYFDNIAVLQPLATGSGAMGTVSNFTASVSSLFVVPLHGYGNLFPYDMTALTLLFPDISISGSTATMSAGFTSAWRVGIYTLNGSSLSLLNSVLDSFGFGGAGATNNSTGFAGGFRFNTVASSVWSSSPVFKKGSRYWLAWLWSSSGVVNQTGSMAGAYIFSSGQRSGLLGVSNLTATSNGWAPFYGIYTAQTSALPASIGSNQLQKTGSMAGFVPHLIMAQNAFLTVF
jgi:hypothetical protein